MMLGAGVARKSLGSAVMVVVLVAANAACVKKSAVLNARDPRDESASGSRRSEAEWRPDPSPVFHIHTNNDGVKKQSIMFHNAIVYCCLF